MNQLTFYQEDKQELITIEDASDWASQYLKRKITNSNISYLLQYGRIKKYKDYRGNTLIKIKGLL